MTEFKALFDRRRGRLLALNRLGRIAIDALALVDKPETSPFDEHFRYMAEHIDAHHQNHPHIDIPEYRVVALLDGLTLIATISEIESYFQDLVSIVVSRYPNKIGRETIDLTTLLNFDSVEESVAYMARDYAARLMFLSPNQYKVKLLDIISAPKDLIDEYWPVFIEAKARRDLGTHNNWHVNNIYRAKVSEVGLEPTPEAALSVNHDYMRHLRTKAVAMMQTLSSHCEQKFA